MDKSTARDDLAVVDRILRTADRTLHIPPGSGKMKKDPVAI